MDTEHFQEKWRPVFRPKMRPTKDGHFQEKHAPDLIAGWRPVFRPKMRPVRYWLVPLLSVATLLGGCALNGDFGRLRPSLQSDDMHAWVGREAVGSIGGRPSEFRLTDNERRLRDLAFALIQPPYDRNRWDSVLAEYGLKGLTPDTPFDPTAYWTHLDVAHRRSEASAYGQLVQDARSDAARIEPFFATAARVVDMDRRRAASLDYVAGSSGISAAENDNALSRNNENTAIIEWVCRSLRERAQSYRFALERLVIIAPSSNAAEAERSLTLLQARTDAYCATAPAVVAKG
jgi:hypothetical protein